MDPGSKDRSNSSGTRTLVKVGDNNNNPSNRRGRNRNRKVFWFNSPFCKLTNIDNHFNRDNPLRKVFNKHIVKISYSFTRNMHNILNNHNKRLLDELIKNGRGPDVASRNCRSKGKCPLGRCCNSGNVEYQVCISPMEHNKNRDRVYVGISAGNWKQRLYKHRHSFSNPRLRNQTISKYFWNLKDHGLTLQVKLKILGQSSTANSYNVTCVSMKK